MIGKIFEFKKDQIIINNDKIYVYFESKHEYNIVYENEMYYFGEYCDSTLENFDKRNVYNIEEFKIKVENSLSSINSFHGYLFLNNDFIQNNLIKKENTDFKSKNIDYFNQNITQQNNNSIKFYLIIFDKKDVDIIRLKNKIKSCDNRINSIKKNIESLKEQIKNNYNKIDKYNIEISKSEREKRLLEDELKNFD